MILNEQNIAALFNNNSPNSAQIHLLGLKPMKPGWMKRLVGREIPDDVYMKALALKGRKPKGALRSEWRFGSLSFNLNFER